MRRPCALWAWFQQPRDTVARWVALTIVSAMLASLALYGVFSLLAGVWANPPLTDPARMEKLAAITRILDAATPEQRAGIADAVSDAMFSTDWLEHHADAHMPAVADPLFRSGDKALRPLLANPQARMEAYEPADWITPGADRRYALLIELRDGSWVMYSVPSRNWGLDALPRNLIVIALVLLSTIVVALIATRHLARPLERFADAVRRFGVDFKAPPIPLVGPREIRQTILAFNAMQAQLQHFLRDRTQMLAAISHDLRAPLTRMRLRGEFIEDAEQRSRLFRDVDEMQAMVNSALDFFRDEARLEQATAFDLAELLHTVVDDFRDTGTEVAFAGPNRFVYVGRPIGMKRALHNLIENAVKYGSEPAVQLTATSNEVEIRVMDHGPGIPNELQEAVFAPFYRVEGSRNKNTGGVGLGLSAARAIVLEHGGRLALRNREGGGLEVNVVLPYVKAPIARV